MIGSAKHWPFLYILYNSLVCQPSIIIIITDLLYIQEILFLESYYKRTTKQKKKHSNLTRSIYSAKSNCVGVAAAVKTDDKQVHLVNWV